jgi:hypothetical protein
VTFTASKSQTRPKAADVRVTYGPIVITVDEDAGHLRSFWGQLGVLLDQIESEPSE